MTAQKRMRQRLRLRFGAFLRTLAARDPRHVLIAARLVQNHARAGRFGLQLSAADISALRRDFVIDERQWLDAADQLAARGGKEAALMVTVVAELFRSDLAGVWTARCEAQDPETRARAVRTLDQIARDERRSEYTRREAIRTLAELREVRRAIKAAIFIVDAALDRYQHEEACRQMRSLGELCALAAFGMDAFVPPPPPDEDFDLRWIPAEVTAQP